MPFSCDDRGIVGVSFRPCVGTGTGGNGHRTGNAAERSPSRSRSKGHDAGSSTELPLYSEDAARGVTLAPAEQDVAQRTTAGDARSEGILCFIGEGRIRYQRGQRPPVRRRGSAALINHGVSEFKSDLLKFAVCWPTRKVRGVTKDRLLSF